MTHYIVSNIIIQAETDFGAFAYVQNYLYEYLCLIWSVYIVFVMRNSAQDKRYYANH